jgi:hypothetical protein
LITRVPFLRIAGPNCSFVKSGDIEEGNWFLSHSSVEFEDFGIEIRVTIVESTMKAMDWIVKPAVISTDPEESVFKAIKLRSREDKNCTWGPEYELKIGGITTAKLYLGNHSTRNLQSTIRVGGKYKLTTHKRTHGEFRWWVPLVEPVENVR